MNKIKELQDKLDSTNEELKNAWYEIFNDSGKIRQAVSNLENSCNYRFNEVSDIELWYCPNFNFPQESIEFLKEYLQDEYCIHYEAPENGSNDLISMLCDTSDECYILNSDDGNIYYNGKVFIEKSSVDSSSEVYNAIEENMDKEGVFPGVFESDRYGNVTLLKGYYKWLKTKDVSND